MSRKAIIDSDSTDSDDDLVPPSPQAVRRSLRIQGRDYPWSQWPSEQIANSLEAAGIPVNTELSRDDLLQLANNLLGSPCVPTTDADQGKRDPPASSKQAGKKRTTKSSSPRPAKKSKAQAQTPSPPSRHRTIDDNNLLIQAVQGLSTTVKSLESRLGAFEKAFANNAPAATLPSTSTAPLPGINSIPGFSYTLPAAASSSSSATPGSSTHPNDQAPFQDTSALSTTAQYNLSTAVPAQAFGKDINLVTLLLPSPAADRQMVDCSDVAVFLKTSDPRVQRNLSFSEFVIAFGIYRDILCQAFPDRREELDLYLAMMADFNQRYGGTLFYEYHKSLSAKSASFITLHNTRIDWSITDTDLLVRHFGGQKILACVICSSHGHSATFCPKTHENRSPAAGHGAERAGASFDVKGRAISEFNGIPLCNNFNESVCTYSKCKFAHICSSCKDPHPKFVCPHRYRPTIKGQVQHRKLP